MTADRTHVAALEDRIGSLRFAMFTFRDEHDHLASQPMTKQDVDAEGGIWFFVHSATALWDSIAHQPEVNISFSFLRWLWPPSLPTRTGGSEIRGFDRGAAAPFPADG